MTTRLPHFTQSWALEKLASCRTTKQQTVFNEKTNDTIYQLCDSLFLSKVSPLQAGFQRLHTKPFMDMCLNSHDEKDVCTVATAYIEACAAQNTPIRMPDTCVK